MVVDSRVFPLDELLADKFDVDFFQREYVWQEKHITDMMKDLTDAFLKDYQSGHTTMDVEEYRPYFMGEIVLSKKGDKPGAIIDGQQRITSLTLLLIFLIQKYQGIQNFPTDIVSKLVYSNHYGVKRFNLDVHERAECMRSLYDTGEYELKQNDPPYLKNIVDRYHDIEGYWDSEIDNQNICHFTWWLMKKVKFSKVWTDDNEFAYVFFESMNDRGLSLTPVELLRSNLLANIDLPQRLEAKRFFDEAVNRLKNIKMASNSKAEFEFFKVYFRGHYSENAADLESIGNSFYRWFRKNEKKLELETPANYLDFLERIAYFAKVYEKIYDLIQERNTVDYLYLIVNSDFKFSLQPALILSTVCYNDSTYVVDNKIKIVSKYLTKVLAWRVWNNSSITQNAMEQQIWGLFQKVRNMSTEKLDSFLRTDPLNLQPLGFGPSYSPREKGRLRVLLALITEIVARESDEPGYLLKKSNYSKIDIEHIWSNHYEQHLDEFDSESDFIMVRNGIGDLLLLPKLPNSSLGDMPYEKKVEQYSLHNILAQSLNEKKYHNNPGFTQFILNSGLPFKPYLSFKRADIEERATLYKEILLWNWR